MLEERRGVLGEHSGALRELGLPEPWHRCELHSSSELHAQLREPAQCSVLPDQATPPHAPVLGRLPLVTPADSLAIAEFLGDALRALHSLPLPTPSWLRKGFLKHHLEPPEELRPPLLGPRTPITSGPPPDPKPPVTDAQLPGADALGGATDPAREGPIDVPCEWEAFVGLLRERRTECRLHLEAL